MKKVWSMIVLLGIVAGGILTACSGQAQTAAAGILFADDFSNPGSGWPATAGDVGSTNYYQDGTYRIHVNESKYDLWANPGKDYADVSLQVDATKTAGSDDNDFGLICRYQDVKNYYFGEVGSSGFYTIGKVQNGIQYSLSKTGPAASDAVKAGKATNTLRFDCVGNTLTLSANGNTLATIKDETFSHGDVGLIAGSFTSPGTEVAFDNFSASQP